MKKLLNISVIAALAILPMAANATDYAVADPTSQADAAAAATTPKWALAQSGDHDGNLATAGYVKGAYNQTMKAINKVATMAENATDSANITYDNDESGLTAETVQDAIDELANEKLDASAANVASPGNYISAGTGVASNLGALDTQVKLNADEITKLEGADTVTGSVANTVKTSAAGANYSNTTSGLTATTLQGAIDEVASTAGSAVQSVLEGSTNGTVSVDGTDVAVHGLGSAAFEDSTAFDAAGSASAVEGKLDDGAAGYDIDAKTLKVQGADVLTGASLTDYAKKIGVTHTISSSTIAGTVPTVTVWGADTPGTAPITASITGATYTETAPTPAGN